MSSISAGTTTGTALVSTGDTTGNLDLKINGSTQAVRVNTSGAIGVGTSPAFGTSGQVLTSAGSAAAPTWSDLPPGGFQGGTTTTSAVDITLTSTSTQVQYVSMTAANKFVILPDATTEIKGSPVFVIINNGEYPFHIKDGAGNIIIYNVISGQTENLTLVNNATAAGSWANDLGTLNLFGGLPQVSSITATASAYYEPTVAMLSATEALIFYCPSSTAISVVLATISGTSVSYGTPSTILTGGAGSYYFLKAMRFNATTGIVSYINGTTDDIFLRAVTVSGGVITVGTAVTLTTSGVGANYYSSMAMLDSTTGFVGYVQSTPTVTVRAFTVSGATITLGGATNVSTDSSEFYGATQISSGKVFFGYLNTAAIRTRVATNSGTTLTLGTQSTASFVLYDVITSTSYDKLTTDVVSGAVGNGDYGFNTAVVPVSGTTVGTATYTLIASTATPPLPAQRAKYLSDGVQACYGTYNATRSMISLYKGNSTIGAYGVSQFNLGLYVTLYGTPFDVIDGNKIIAVGITNGLVTSQIVGVL
jgi:hypothetical protein